MDKQDKSSEGFPGSGLIVLALLAGGALFISKVPLESSRPALKQPQLERREAAQDVDARLWQDPFDAVAKAREPALKSDAGLQNDQRRHGERRLADEIQRQLMGAGRGGAVVMAVMMSSGPHAEAVESRLRTRYAVLAGLKARGFVSADSEHLGYYYPIDGEGPRYGLPEIVPYEVFGAGPDSRNVCGGCRLVVVWLDSSAFYDRPLLKLSMLAQRLSLHGPVVPADTPAVRWRVLGPSTSDGLRAIIDEKTDKAFAAAALKPFDFRFFSAAATAPDAALLRDAQAPADSTVSSFLAKRDVSLLRTIGTDDRLARALVNELELRGLRTRPPNGRKVKCPDPELGTDAEPEDLPSSIAIVSEGDTLYGRSLRQQFRYDAVSDRPGFCVTRWHYFRGLDGRVPGDALPAAATASRKENKSDGTDAIGRDAAYLERPEGPSQFDYLRRLATRIREEDANLRKRHGREYGIRAIGVLGNDVYDKLLVLQALQTEMPHAIFFTTDLDARLFHPREQDWARNLIVASNFGLRLANPLQRDIAPFRDSYQSSAYLGTLLLLADAGEAINAGAAGGQRLKQGQISGWFDKPRLFEVSRSGVFDFSEPVDGARPAAPLQPDTAAVQQLFLAVPGDGERSTRCSRRSLAACREIHPDPSPMVPHSTFAARLLVFGTLSLALWAPALALSRSGKRRLRRFVAGSPPHTPGRVGRVAALLAAMALLAVGLPWVLATVWPQVAEAMTRDGKPLSFADGISPWPTYGIRIATLVLCAYLAVRAWSSLASNADRIAREFRLGATRRHLNAVLDAEDRDRRPWSRVCSMLSVRFYQERPLPLGDGPVSMTPPAETFWKHYLVQNRASARLLRTGLAMLLMMGLSLLVAYAIGDAPIAPQRGDLTVAMQAWSTLPAALAVLFLILFVVDATTLCVLLVHGLRLHHANWPKRTLQAFQARTGVPPGYLGEWIDLQFVARRTRCVGGLIYYPFIVLSLMLLARSSFFDDWYTPPSVAALAALNFAIVLCCAFALRRAAEASRRQALDRLRDAVLRAKGEDDKVRVSQLQVLSERIQDLREGAFAPYSQQPLLKAVLLPLLTFGGSSLFDYLALANL